ncbi:hypothetical protein ABT275_03700 [Streptomyces sp. NPDC001185]|uniref:hypothetical protein n=1 Tax=Streptomyces sp. NPDC001185 TaxID=3154380 RepID=UPI0033298D87
MSFDDITLFIIAMAVGAQLMNFLHMRWDAQIARRDLAASRAARRRASADLFFSTFLGYQWKNRSRP